MEKMGLMSAMCTFGVESLVALFEGEPEHRDPRREGPPEAALRPLLRRAPGQLGEVHRGEFLPARSYLDRNRFRIREDASPARR